MKKRIFTLAILIFSGLLLSAQTATISGVIKGADEEALIGASVLVKNTSIGTITDTDGSYMLQVEAGTYTLKVSYVGYGDTEQTVSVIAGEKSTVNFTLSVGTQLDEVVVSGSKKPFMPGK